MIARVSSLILRSSRVIAWRMFRSFFSLPGVTTTWRKLLAHLGILVQLNISSIVFQFWSSFCSIVESPSSELVFLLKSSNSCEPEELFVIYFPNNWHTATTLETRPVKSSDWVWLLSFKCLYTNMKPWTGVQGSTMCNVVQCVFVSAFQSLGSVCIKLQSSQDTVKHHQVTAPHALMPHAGSQANRKGIAGEMSH